MSLNKHAAMATFAIILVASLALHLNLTASSSVITVPDDYAKIQDAINAAHEGDTVFVRAGQYTENITVDKPLNLVGEDRQTTIIDGNFSMLSMTIILVEANYVNISGFTIQNGLYKMQVLGGIIRGSPFGGIGLSGSVGSTIRNNTTQRVVAGVAIGNGSGNTTVSDNNIPTGGIGAWSAFGVVSASAGALGGNTITGNNISFYYGIDILKGPNNKIAGNQLNCTGEGIVLDDRDNIISNNTISAFLQGFAAGTGGGIDAYHSDDNVISNNSITAGGLTLYGCSNNTIRDNNVSSFGVEGTELSSFLHDIDTSNTVNGRPIYYLVNQSNLVINPFTYPDMGYLGLVNSHNMSLWRLTFTNETQGLMLAQTTMSEIDEVSLSSEAEGMYMWNCSNVTIMGNTVTSSGIGIDMNLCTDNVIRGNTLQGNGIGLHLVNSSDNTLHRNNFIANGWHTYREDDLLNEWDDKMSTYLIGWEPLPVGNYWDNYNGTLPAQGVDNYPLMKPWIPVLGDVDYNGVVNMRDLARVAKNFHATSP